MSMHRGEGSPLPKGDQSWETRGTSDLQNLPIFQVLDRIDFDDHFVVLGDVGTGKSTVVPVHEFERSGHRREIIIREPSRASCNALYYSLAALHPEKKDDLAIITKDTQLNVGGMVKMVTDGVLLRMLAERSISNASVYFDESHQMSSQLELCMSLAKKEEADANNLFRVMSATIDPSEFLRFLGISKLYTATGRRFPVKTEVELVDDLDAMFYTLSASLRSLPRAESWLVFLPTRRLVERYAGTFGGVYIHGGLDGSEINRIQKEAESRKGLRIFATNVIASSVNLYVDNVMIFNDALESKDRLGQKSLKYNKIDNNTLLQMMGRVGRFKPGRAVIITDSPVPKDISPGAVRKSLESETPFDLVLLMSKYGLKLADLEFMSKVNYREVSFAEEWLAGVGAIEPQGRRITWKGLLMSEVPYDPDFAHMVSSALVEGDYDAARFFLASGAFGDSLNHAYKSDHETRAREMLYRIDRTNELNIKANLLRMYSQDADGSFLSRLDSYGIFHRFIEEASKNYDAALSSLNDMLASSKREVLPREVMAGLDVRRVTAYLDDCLSFERFHAHEKEEYDLRNLEIGEWFYARSVTVNYRKILFDVVSMPYPGRHGGHRQRSRNRWPPRGRRGAGRKPERRGRGF